MLYLLSFRGLVGSPRVNSAFPHFILHRIPTVLSIKDPALLDKFVSTENLVSSMKCTCCFLLGYKTLPDQGVTWTSLIIEFLHDITLARLSFYQITTIVLSHLCVHILLSVLFFSVTLYMNLTYGKI